MGRPQPGGGAAPGAPSPASEPGTRGEAPPLSGAPGVRSAAEGAACRPRTPGRSFRLDEWTSVSRVFTDPARTLSPSALYARRRSHRMVFSACPAPPARVAAVWDSLGRRACGGGRQLDRLGRPLCFLTPDCDVSRTVGAIRFLPYGLYLTGLEVLRRSHSLFFFSSKGI